MNSISQFSPKRKSPNIESWQDAILRAKRRMALLRLLADQGMLPAMDCVREIPRLNVTDIKTMRELKWIGVSDDGGLYLKADGRALLSAPEQGAGDGQ